MDHSGPILVCKDCRFVILKKLEKKIPVKTLTELNLPDVIVVNHLSTVPHTGAE